LYILFNIVQKYCNVLDVESRPRPAPVAHRRRAAAAARAAPKVAALQAFAQRQPSKSASI
jgi:hypothetical protein